MNIQQIPNKSYNYNTQNRANKNYQQNVAFEGRLPGLEKEVTKGLGKLVQSPLFEKMIKKINKHPKIADNLFAHLTVLGSTLLAIFYVGKTLNNKAMEEDKRKTLAVNQGLVWGASTVLAYTLDKATSKNFKALVAKFEKVNDKMAKADRDVLVKGLGMAKSMIAIDLVYRFIAPVLVTPLANHIGNKLKENKAAKLAQTNSQKMDKVA